MEQLFDKDSTGLSINYAQIEVDILNLDEMFDEIQVRMGVRIDVALAGWECLRENMIQISTLTTILLWDVKKHEQYQTITGY